LKAEGTEKMSSDDEERKPESEKISLSLKLKKWKLLLAYHLKHLPKKLNFAYILFILSLFLFFAILIPNLAHRLPFPAERFPYVFGFQGTVSFLTNSSDPNSLVAASFAQIEIGGYSTTADIQGKFLLPFVSQIRTEIPVIISWRNVTLIQRISFNDGQFEKSVLITLG